MPRNKRINMEAAARNKGGSHSAKRSLGRDVEVWAVSCSHCSAFVSLQRYLHLWISSNGAELQCVMLSLRGRREEKKKTKKKRERVKKRKKDFVVILLISAAALTPRSPFLFASDTMGLFTGGCGGCGGRGLFGPLWVKWVGRNS